MSLTFSVVINTLNRACLLRNAIDGLRHQRHDSFEIIVVNGPSKDQTEAFLANQSDVRSGRCPEANLSMSRNIGIAMARGDIVAFLDDDAVPEPAWLTRLEIGYRAKRVGAVGGYIRDHTGVRYQSRVTVCDRLGDCEGFEAATSVGLEKGGDRPWRFLSPTGANASFRRSALLEIGGFDETFAYFLDETDVNIRLLEAGWEVRFVPGAEVHHKYAPSAQRDHKKVPHSLFNPCCSKAYFALRHARPEMALGDILNHLSRHALTLRWHNKNLFELGMIDAAHHDRLNRSIEDGLKSGVVRGYSSGPPKLMRQETRDEHTHGTFRPIRQHLAVNRRLRLAFVSREYPPGPVGGIGVWTETAARALSERGHEVSVVTLAEGAPTIDFQNGVWVHRIAPNHRLGRRAPPLPDLPVSVSDHLNSVHDEISRIRVERGLDLVSWPIWDLEGLAVQAAGLLPTVVSLHTTYALSLPSKPEWRQNRLYRRQHVDKVIAAERELLATAPHLLANSTRLIEDIEAAYGLSLDSARIRTIAHGLRDMANAVPSPPLSRSRRVRLLFVGRIEERKGADLLLSILPAILGRHPNVEMRLIGNPVKDERGVGLADRFIARNKNEPWFPRVCFDGAVSSEELFEAYAACDVFIAPSRYESFGLVFVEAMMFAKPCVAFNIGGVSEVVADGETGLLAPPCDAAALQVAIECLIDDADLRTRLGNAGRRRYETTFTAALMGERLEHLYRTLLSSPKHRRDRHETTLRGMKAVVASATTDAIRLTDK